MQLNIFLKLAPLLKEKNYNSEEILKFLDEHYNSGDIVYPGAICRKTKIDMKNIYEVLEECYKQGLVERLFDIFCPNCCKYTGERYGSFISIPKDTFCPNCDNEITDCYNHALIIYRVLKL